MQNTPKHVAIIMDGNRRWAKQQGLSKMMGHKQGIKSIEKVLEAAKDAGVEVLTLYTFSTENWKRSKKEIDFLMSLLETYLDKEYKKLVENNIKLMTIGRLDRFKPALRKKMERVKDLTKANSGIVLNLALDYGARDEIINASRRIAEDAESGRIKTADINEEFFSKYLCTGGLPDPGLLIRTGGEFRVSNFLLWQISYAEIYVTKKFWPEFGKRDFERAIQAYKKRDRRLGI
jgi:undecaprenyl diphosphate synthase